MTEFWITIYLKQAFTRLELVFLCSHALSRAALHELAIGYAYACCARFAEVQREGGPKEDNNDQASNVRATIF